MIAILDADKEGFLRSTRSLIQIIGRAARNEHGKVIMYADKYTKSMDEAINETNRRRQIQVNYNTLNGIIPTTIIKPIQPPLHNFDEDTVDKKIVKGKMTVSEKEKFVKELHKQMREAAKAFDFEKAAELRDYIFEIQAQS